MATICVFCGAAAGQKPEWAAVAKDLGQAIAQQTWSLLYGGGNTGLMGAVAEGALSQAGEVIGIMPTLLVERERAHGQLTRLECVQDMATRKARLIELADAFVVLPGGMGTLDELFEVLTWYQLGLHQKYTFILNHNGFYDALLSQLEHQQQAGFVHGGSLPLISVDSVAALIEALAQKLKEA